MCARRSGNILFYFLFFADNFTGSKDTEPYKMDVSFFFPFFFLSVYLSLQSSTL